jgi:uncharacterized protein YaaQ
VEQAIKIIGDCCKSRKEYIANQFVGEYNTVITAPIEITVGGATIFVLDVEQFHKV